MNTKPEPPIVLHDARKLALHEFREAAEREYAAEDAFEDEALERRWFRGRNLIRIGEMIEAAKRKGKQ